MPEDNVIEFPEQPRQKRERDDIIRTVIFVECGTEEDDEFRFRLQDKALGIDMTLEGDGAIAAMAVFVAAMRGIRDLFNATQDGPPEITPPMAMVLGNEGSA